MGLTQLEYMYEQQKKYTTRTSPSKNRVTLGTARPSSKWQSSNSIKDINDVSAESWSNSDDTQDKNEGLEEIHPYVKARSVFHCVNGQLHFIFHLANFAKLCNGGFFLKIDRISQKKKATAFKLVVAARGTVDTFKMCRNFF